MPLSNDVYSIEGFLSAAEAELLYRLATEVSPNGRIVEIGSYRGKSTVCLGLGAKWAGAQVWAIDPHNDYQVNESTHYGMENHAALLANLVKFEVADTVRVVALASIDVWEQWPTRGQAIDLLWIDGLHDYDSVSDDLTYWMQYCTPVARIAVHDHSEHFPDVRLAVETFTRMWDWRILEQTDATVVLGRDHA